MPYIPQHKDTLENHFSVTYYISFKSSWITHDFQSCQLRFQETSKKKIWHLSIMKAVHNVHKLVLVFKGHVPYPSTTFFSKSSKFCLKSFSQKLGSTEISIWSCHMVIYFSTIVLSKPKLFLVFIVNCVWHNNWDAMCIMLLLWFLNLFFLW